MAQSAEEKAKSNREKSAKWRESPENREKTKVYMKAWRAANVEKRRALARKNAGMVGATGETRHGPCDICDKARRLVCDHDHETGLIRGWLCYLCNISIGRTKADAVTRAGRILQYVNKEPSNV